MKCNECGIELSEFWIICSEQDDVCSKCDFKVKKADRMINKMQCDRVIKQLELKTKRMGRELDKLAIGMCDIVSMIKRLK